MENIKRDYSFTNGRQIWRLLLTDLNKIIIEDRDKISKEVFFNCLDINSGKVIFKNFQLEDKFWVGIETVYKDIIYFHKFLKPDMPVHTGIIAYDINSSKILWKTDEYNFLFIKDEKVYAFKNKFEGRDFLTFNYKNGNKLESLGADSTKVNFIREKELIKNNFNDYLFPEPVNLSENSLSTDIIKELKIEKVITGVINFITLNNLLMINFHEVLSNGNLRNTFRIIEIGSKKVILEEVLDKETKLLIPESFFIKNNQVFLIKEKVKLIVYSF